MARTLDCHISFSTSYTIFPCQLRIQKPYKGIPNLIDAETAGTMAVVLTDVGAVQSDPLTAQTLQPRPGQHTADAAQIIGGGGKGDMRRDKDRCGRLGDGDRDTRRRRGGGLGLGFGEGSLRGRVLLCECSDGVDDGCGAFLEAVEGGGIRRRRLHGRLVRFDLGAAEPAAAASGSGCDTAGDCGGVGRGCWPLVCGEACQAGSRRVRLDRDAGDGAEDLFNGWSRIRPWHRKKRLVPAVMRAGFFVAIDEIIKEIRRIRWFIVGCR